MLVKSFDGASLCADHCQADPASRCALLKIDRGTNGTPERGIEIRLTWRESIANGAKLLKRGKW